jgi:hypothetical protein
MTDPHPATPTPLGHAKAAAAALQALTALPRAQLAANPTDVYALVDELLPVVYELSRICDRLAGQLNDWAALAATHRRSGDLPDRLHTAASQLGMHAVNHTCWAHQRMDDALAALDRPRYRTDRGIPLDWEPTR